MKNTLEELKLAQAKGCRIEYCDVDDGDWFVVGGDFAEKMSKAAAYKFRIHPADEWKARLPRLREGAEWHRNDFTNEMLEGGYRPLMDREVIESGDEFLAMLDTDPEWTSYPLSDDTDDGSNASIGHLCDSVFFPHRTRRPVPTEFLHPDELAKQPEAAQAPDFGEPWKLSPLPESEITDNGGCLLDIAQANRGIICTNALAGVPDPAEFVRQAMEMKEAIGLAYKALIALNHEGGCYCDAQYAMHGAHPRHSEECDMANAALAKLKPFLP